MPAVDAPIRNVRFDPSDPVSDWSAEVIEIVSWSEHYGVDELMSAVIDRARRHFDTAARLRYASRLRERRLAAGVTQQELAETAGTSKSRLSAYENGSVAPTTTVLGRIQVLLDAW